MPLLPPTVLQTAKAGNRADECEDASRVVYSLVTDTAWLALCDGASESAFARDWAQILADDYAENPFDPAELSQEALAGWLGRCGEKWSEVVPWERIPWHGEAKTRAGALATFLTLAIDLSPNPCGAFPWKAAAIGDCCFFVIREDSLHLAFPMDSPAQFGNAPPLVCSNPANNGGVWARAHQSQGEFRPGDLVILASDALAAWFLEDAESGGKPWQKLAGLREEDWEEWVAGKRNERALKNDDTTLIIVPVS